MLSGGVTVSDDIAPASSVVELPTNQPTDQPTNQPTNRSPPWEQVVVRLRMIVRELVRSSSDLFYAIMNEYRDVVLSSWYPAAARTILEELRTR